MFARIVTSIAGFALIVYGVIAAISPLPVGLPFLALGLIVIAMANPQARPLIRRMRTRWRWFDRLVAMAGKHAPKGVKSTIDETNPAALREPKDDDE